LDVSLNRAEEWSLSKYKKTLRNKPQGFFLFRYFFSKDPGLKEIGENTEQAMEKGYGDSGKRKRFVDGERDFGQVMMDQVTNRGR